MARRSFIHTHTAAGTYHLRAGMPTQDIVFTAENERFRMVALADGAGSCKNAELGAAVACRSMACQLMAAGQYYMDMPGEETARFVLRQIRKELTAWSRKSGDAVEEYASTAMCLLWDKDTDRLLCLNLGDGLILGVDDEGCVVLSQPDIHDEGCCVTTTRGAEFFCTVRMFHAARFRSVTLLSDGAWRVLYHRNKLDKQAKAWFNAGDFASLRSYMRENTGYDDAGYIGLRFTPAEGGISS